MSEASDRIAIESVAVGDAQLQVAWRDGHISDFPNIWLLEACSCRKCGTTETAVRHVTLTTKPEHPRIENTQLSTNELIVDWGDNHHSCFDSLWLRAHCLSATERKRRKHKPTLWGAEMADSLRYLSYDEVASDASCHLQFLEAVRDHGFAILQNVPTALEQTEKVASLIGKLRMTNYGIFELEAKPAPEIVGDMAVPLNLHTDEPYRVDPPAITFFHVLAQSDSGGESTLIDGCKLAETLRQRHPQAFDILSRTPARFHRTLAEGRAFEMQSPIIQCDRDGQVFCIRLLDRAMAPADISVAEVEPFYRALRELLGIVYAQENMITVKLLAGEMLVFNNQRLLHGRTGFDPAGSKRHVRSCHVDLDEFYSRLRVTYRALNREEAWMAFSTGASV